MPDEPKLTHWKNFHNPDYLGAYALSPGEELTATIASVGMEPVTGSSGKKEDCMVARFAERNIKPMVLNATNCKTIAKMFGTPYVEQWTGRKIQVYATEVQAFGDTVEALRVRPKEPKQEHLAPGHPKWEGAVRSFAQGDIGLEGIRKHFILSDANAEILQREASNA